MTQEQGPQRHKTVGTGDHGVIVLHGWFGDSSVFDPMLPALDTDRFTFAFMDYRGYGVSGAIKGDYTLDEICSDAVELADHLGWSQFDVIGHSMGGMAVQKLCLQAPDRVRRAVCMTPVPASGPGLDEGATGLFTGAAENDENRSIIIGMSTGNRLPASWIRHMVAESRRTTHQDAFAGYFESWGNSDFSDRAKGLKTPMLVLAGEHDLALTPDVMRQTFLQWYPNARLEVIRNSGHYPMCEAPIATAMLIETFLDDG